MYVSLFLSVDNATGDSNIELNEIVDYKDTNDVKTSKSCPVIYKVFKHNDGTTIHELLSEDLSKGLRLNKSKIENEEQETPLHHKPQMEREKLNIILDENGKSTLYDSLSSSSKSQNNKKDIKQLSLDLMSNTNNKLNMSEKTNGSMPSQPISTPPTVEAYDSNKRAFDSFAYNDDIPSTSASSTSASSSVISPRFPSLATTPTSTSNDDD